MLEVPFKKFSSLEVLILVGCHDLTNDTAASIIELKKLTELSIRISRLHDSIDWIGNLTSLCKLEISDTDITKLPDSIGRLKQLKELGVHNCYSLERVPELPLSLTHLCLLDVKQTMQVDWSSQFKLTNIIELEIRCGYASRWRDEELSFEWIRSATNLKKLCLHLPCYIITGLEKVDELSRLEHLHISNARFQYLQHLPSSLLHLQLYYCEFLDGVLDVSNSKDLEYLRVKECYSTKDDRLVEIKGLGESLHTLELKWCCKLKSIHVLGALNELESLKLWACESLECVLDLSKSRKLKWLELSGCDELRNIQGLAELESLKHVEFFCCWSLELSDADLSKLENAQNRTVDIRYCNKLPNVSLDHPA